MYLWYILDSEVQLMLGYMVTAVVVMKYSMIAFCSVMLRLNLKGVYACVLCIIRLAVFHENWFSGMAIELCKLL